MRIVGRSESSSLPSLETLLPMEKSWALQVEREEEALCLQAKNEHIHRGTESAKQIGSSWVSCKRLNSGNKEAFHRSRKRENEHYGKRESRCFDSKTYSNDQHHDSSRPLEETKRAWQFTSSTRCYPPSIHIKSSEIPASAEERASPLRTQRGLHEARRFVRPEKTSNSFVSRQRFSRSKDGISRESQGVKPFINTLRQRQGRFARPDHRGEMTSLSEASGKIKDHGDDVSHFQGHQELNECKHQIQPLFDMHRQYRCGQHPVKFELSECRSIHWSARKVEHQGPCCGVTDQKNAMHSGRSIRSEMKQHNDATLALQSFEDKLQVANGENVASEAVTTTENVLPEGISMFESSCTEESEVKSDDSIVEKEQYEMLAALLFDDLQDIDENFDVACVSEGPGCEHGGFLDDELEVSLDNDVVKEDKEGMLGTLPAACAAKHPEFNSGKASVVRSSASQHSKTSHDAHTSSGLKKSPPVLVDVTNKFEIHASAGVKGEVQEDDVHRLSQRQRQIDFGKNTLGYEHYTELIPRTKRKARDPQTPNPKQVCSKRSWDGQIRKWRRLLHAYDPPSEDGEEIAEDFSILKLKQSNLEGNGPDLKQDTSLAVRFAEADESKGCNAVGKGKNVRDANLTIYDDWMES